jgi:hypothetical protein
MGSEQRPGTVGVNRRRFLATMGAAAAGAAVAGTPASAFGKPERGGPIGSDLPSAGTLRDEIELMVGLGQRIGGTASHRRWLDYIEERFQRAGLRTMRDTQYLGASTPSWNATRWQLSIGSGWFGANVPVASYYPYSGETPPNGVQAQMADVGTGSQAEFAAQDLHGKIAFVTETFPAQYETFASFFPTFDYLYDPDATVTPTSAFRKACYNIFSPTLGSVPALAAAAGCVGVVVALDSAPLNAAGQYLPFAKPHGGVPILYLDRDTGRAVKQRLARGDNHTRLVLAADVGPAAVDNLTAILPGATDDEYLWVLTHSDGCNECEENAPLALLALAEQAARKPRSQRQRSLAFHLTLHMTPYAATNGAYFEQAQPELFSKVVGLLHMEHLGQRDWIDDPAADTFRPTGLPEVAFMDVSRNPALISGVSAAIRAQDLRRTAVTNRTASVGSSYDATLPTVGFMTYPNQMLSWGVTPDFRHFTQNIDKVDPSRMQAEIQMLSRVLGLMDAMPTATLQQGL